MAQLFQAVLSVPVHGAELVAGEFAAILADATLLEEDGAGRGQLDERGDDEHGDGSDD